MPDSSYLPLRKKFDCLDGRHKFETEVKNPSVVKEVDQPLMYLVLMQLGDLACKLCGKKRRVYRTGVATGDLVPDGDWQEAFEEDVRRFNGLKKLSVR